MQIVPAPGWARLANELLREKGTAILLGAADSGKSTLARYLLESLLRKSASVCLVDCDVGQSVLGLPGTITSAVFKHPSDLSRFRPQGIFFVGSDNPAKSMGGMIEGAARMAALCKKKKADITLVDTTGLISGWAGKALKTGKVRRLKPRHIMAIERKGELEQILSAMKALPPEDGKGVRVHRLRPSEHAHNTGRLRRASYREKKFRDYFSGATVIKFPFEKVRFFRKGRALDIKAALEPDGEVKPGCLAGLGWGEEETLGLGIFEGVDPSGVVIMTPVSLARARRVDRISFGEIMAGDFLAARKK